MSVFGSRSAEINLDEFERRLRAAGTHSAGAEDPLSELARLVDASWPAAPSAASTPKAEFESAPGLEAGVLRPEFEGPQGHQDESEGLYEDPQAPELDEARHLDGGTPGHQPRSRSWTLRVAALAVVGVGMIGAVFALRGGVPGLPKQPPFIAAAQGPTKVQPPSEDTVGTANEPGANLLKDGAQAAHVKVLASEEQPVDLNAQGSVGAPVTPVNHANTTAEPAAANGTLVKGTVDTPVIVAPAPALPSVAQQFPDPKPVRTVSLRPDGTPIPSSAAGATDAGDSAPASEAPKPPAKPAAKPSADAEGNAQPSTPKLDLPTKLSAKSSARVVVAKADATGAATETANEPLQLGSPTKSEKAAKASKPQQAAAIQTASEAAPTQQAVESPAATPAAGWSVQLAAPKSEAEAKSTVARLNAKYASALNGSSIGVHKAVVNGETIYRLRVGGLSKADAAALCARLKGDGGECFIAK